MSLTATFPDGSQEPAMAAYIVGPNGFHLPFPVGGGSGSPNADMLAAARANRAYVLSSGRLQLTAAGNARALLSNASNSGARLFVSAITCYSDISATWGALYRNPTQNIPSALLAPARNLNGAGTDNTNITLRGDAGILITVPAMAAGTGTRIGEIPLEIGRRTAINQGVFVIDPGNSIGISLAFAGVGNAEVMAWCWTEAI